jgi:multiple sugar transport system substrate-binding protein
VTVPVERVTRGGFLRRAGAATASVALGAAAAPYAFAGPLRFSGRWLAGDLSVVQWQHFVPAYNAWFRTWAREWGERNDVEVTVDLEIYTELPALAAAEAKARRGHDVFGFLSPPARYEGQVIDHTAVVREIEESAGPYGELGRMSTYNPRTRRFFGVADYHVPAPLLWRHDLWNELGQSPATWESVRAAAPALRASGHPIGIGMANDADSNVALLSLLLCFGASLQDEAGGLAIDSERTVEAVEFMADLQARGGESAVYRWDATANNQHILSGKGSLIVNAISPIRRADDLGMPFARDLWIWPVPQGPAARLGVGQYTSVYSIWRFARNREAAEAFLAELALAAPAATAASRFFNFPCFPGAHPAKQIYKAASADPHAPKGKYSILTTVASTYTRNAGYPGHTNAAVQDALDLFLIPRMFAQAAQGRMSAAESVSETAARMRTIWAHWRGVKRI